MLLPEELKRTDFQRTIRGYQPTEVDDYIDFLIEKYTALDRANDELERKLAVALKALDEYRDREDELRRMKKEAQRISATMIANTEAKCGRTMHEAEIYSEKVMAELNEKIKEKKRLIDEMSDTVTEFRNRLFRLYSSHISLLEEVATLASDTAASATEAFRENAPEVADDPADEFTPKDAAISFATKDDGDFVDLTDAIFAEKAADSDEDGTLVPDSEAFDAGMRDAEAELGRARDIDSFDFVNDILNRRRQITPEPAERKRPANKMTLTTEFELMFESDSSKKK